MEWQSALSKISQHFTILISLAPSNLLFRSLSSEAKIEILYGSVAESTFSASARRKNPSTTCARGEQRLEAATIILKRFHINSKCDWISFPAKRSIFPSRWDAKKIMSHAWSPCQIENFLVFRLLRLITRLRFHMLIKNLVSIIAADIDFTNLIKKRCARVSTLL